MTDQELRALIRDSMARHLGTPPHASPAAPSLSGAGASSRTHASHGLLPLASGGDGDGACLIEPAVRCNHCGYCLSYGH
ncbi:MAG TPA: hypothetical protein VGQ16_12920 [Vicinamibacterales bacterium]|jgi:hypothetical protein|nr:hypothetical protein [Vicinamibacterales bacterium]